MRDVEDEIRSDVANALDLNKADVHKGDDLVNDLGADSLGIVELLLSVEERFDIEIEDEEWAKVRTVGDAAALVERKTGGAT